MGKAEPVKLDYSILSPVIPDELREKGEAMSAAATEMLFEFATLDEAIAASPKKIQVLDLACGAGDPSIELAQRLKDTGWVIGIDLADDQIARARDRVRVLKLANVIFIKSEAHAMKAFPPYNFDRVISRFGIMFFELAANAMVEARRVLKTGGQVAMLAWGPQEQPFFEATVGTILKMRPELEMPQNGKRLFRCAESGTLKTVLERASFADVKEETRTVRWDWHGAPEELWHYFQLSLSSFRQLLMKVADDDEVQRAVIDALGKYYDGEYVHMEAKLVAAKGTKVASATQSAHLGR